MADAKESVQMERSTGGTASSPSPVMWVLPAASTQDLQPSSTPEESVLDAPPPWVVHLMAHLDWPSRTNLFTLNCSWRGLMGVPGIWRALTSLLAAETKLYLPPTLQTSDSRALFGDMWRLRKQWAVQEEQIPQPEALEGDVEPAVVEAAATANAALGDSAAAQTAFSITVCARFRPAATRLLGVKPAAVVLPLHQRVQLIKASRKGECTTREAFQQIMREQGHTIVEDPWSNAAVRHLQPDEEQEKVRERRRKDAAGDEDGTTRGGRALKAQVMSLNQPPGCVLAVAPSVGLRPFQFDHVFETDSGQQAVYEKAAQRTVVDVMNGLDSSIIVYGQTGSGKTFTMFGPEEAIDPTEPSAMCNRDAGIVPRACQELFAAGAERRRKEGIETEIEVSFVEVYGNQVNDLLKSRAGVGQSRVAGQRYVLDGSSAEVVADMQQLHALLRRGHQQKRQAATAMNERSTRAHSLVVVGVRQCHVHSGRQVNARLFLADLGGSEKIGQSEANADVNKAAGTVAWSEYYAQRVRLQETMNINRGLFSLKQCIDALNDQAAAAVEGRAPPHIPYQDSKLTMLLSSALGGNSKTLVIVTASLDPNAAVETVQTLRFGERCANVVNKSTLSRTVHNTLAALDREIEAMEALIHKQERWETRTTRRQDVDGDELVHVTVLVGAEDSRKRLEELLCRRRELLGDGAA